MSLTNGRTLCLGLALVVLAAYANHFQNDFHFDDIQTVVANPYIRDLANIPRFFKDATLFSAQVGGQNWRPIVSTSGCRAANSWTRATSSAPMRPAW